MPELITSMERYRLNPDKSYKEDCYKAELEHIDDNIELFLFLFIIISSIILAFVFSFGIFNYINYLYKY